MFQDGVQLEDSARLSQQKDGTTHCLLLKDVAQQDAGVYTCLAQNAAGQVLCKAELLVHGGKSQSLPGPGPLGLHMASPVPTGTPAQGSHGPQAQAQGTACQLHSTGDEGQGSAFAVLTTFCADHRRQ